jgi:hypothetical protein
VNGATSEYPLEPYPYFGGYPQCNQHGFYYEVRRFTAFVWEPLRNRLGLSVYRFSMVITKESVQ